MTPKQRAEAQKANAAELTKFVQKCRNFFFALANDLSNDKPLTDTTPLDVLRNEANNLLAKALSPGR